MNDTALITGASSGIGKELARLHAASGGDLVLVARRQQALEELKQELESKHGVTVRCIALDLTAPASGSAASQSGCGRWNRDRVLDEQCRLRRTRLLS